MNLVCVEYLNVVVDESMNVVAVDADTNGVVFVKISMLLLLLMKL